MPLPSALQTAVVAQITQQYASLITSMHTWIRANPTATAAQATTQLNALADPYPSDTVKITDRAAAFNWLAGKVHPYEGKATAYLSLRQLMIDHPVAFIFSIDYDAGRFVTTKAEAYYRRITGDNLSGWETADMGADYSCTRNADGSLATETYTKAVDATTVSISRTYTGGVPGAWSIV